MPSSESQLDSALRLLRVLQRHWPLTAVMTVLGIGGGFLYAARQVPVYAATSEVAVGNDPWRSLIPGEFSGGSPYSERMTFETQPLVIQSTPVAERAARNLGLPASAAGSIRGDLRVGNIEGTRAFTLHVEAGEAVQARDYANALADAYIQVSTENRVRSARESVRWLETQLADYEAKVQKSHQALIDYIEREKLTRPGASLDANRRNAPPLIDRLREMKVEAEIEADRLSERYGEKHPDLLQKRADVMRLGAKINAEESLQREAEKKNIGYDILAGRARADLDLYGVLARKLEQANISSSLVENAITVVEYAGLPSAPVRPNRTEIIFLGSLAGLLFGIGGAFLRETLDLRITSSAQVKELTDVPLLGTIPDVAEHEVYGDPSRLTLFSPTATPGSEAFRILRTNVKFALVGVEKRVLVVTSSSPGEGKSMVTANLAAALANTGLKVLMVDADLRRPTLHRYAGGSARRRGLSTLIAGECDSLEDILQRGGPGMADLIPAGPTPPNPGDFLASPRLEKYLAVMREQYDVVLIDSPPGTLFADAQVLASHAGGVLVVLRAGVAEKPGVLRLFSQLAQARLKTIGCVLNGVAPGEIAYYDGEYRYGPRAGGDADEGEVAKLPRARGRW